MVIPVMVLKFRTGPAKIWAQEEMIRNYAIFDKWLKNYLPPTKDWGND